MVRYIFVLFALLAPSLTACDHECGSPFVSTASGNNSKEKVLDIVVRDLETNDYIETWEVIWIDLDNPETFGIMSSIYGDRGMPGVFEGPIEKANRIRITVSSPGYQDESFDFEFEKNECDRYWPQQETILLSKVGSTEGDINDAL